MMDAEMYECISEGIDFLNGEFGDIHAWIGAIDLDTLRMSSTTECIIGQLYGNYTPSLWLAYGEIGYYSGHRYGFDDVNQNYQELTEAWQAVIAGLRAVL